MYLAATSYRILTVDIFLGPVPFVRQVWAPSQRRESDHAQPCGQVAEAGRGGGWKGPHHH